MDDNYEFDVFISFVSSEQNLVEPIWQRLKASGLRVFWSDDYLKERYGENWIGLIQDSLEKSRHLILICTKESMKSKWVKREYETFYYQFHDGSKRRLIPLLMKGFNVKNLPLFLRPIQAVKYFEGKSLESLIKIFSDTPIQESKKVISPQELLPTQHASTKEFSKVLNNNKEIKILKKRKESLKDEKTDDSKTAAEFKALAFNSFKNKDYQKALEYYTKVLEIDPNFPNFKNMKNKCLEKLDSSNELKGDPNCKSCKGSGECHWCKYSGECYWCKGSGKCDKCGGTGKMGDRDCPYCKGTGNCHSCDGNGKCYWCKGTGKCSKCSLK